MNVIRVTPRFSAEKRFIDGVETDKNLECGHFLHFEFFFGPNKSF